MTVRQCTLQDPTGSGLSQTRAAAQSNSMMLDLINDAGDGAVDWIREVGGFRDPGAGADAGVGAEVDTDSDVDWDVDHAMDWMDEEFGLPPDYVPEPGIESSGFITPIVDAGVNMAIDSVGATEFVEAAGTQQQRVAEAAGLQPVLDVASSAVSDPVVGDMSILMGLGGARAVAKRLLVPGDPLPDGLAQRGARGATPRDADEWGTHTGQHSGRPFFPDDAGGPIEDLSTDRIRVTDRGVDVVDRHISRFGDDPANRVMQDRLRRIAAGDLEPTPQDLNFYSHELREFVRYRRNGYADGVPQDMDAGHKLWNDAHTATLEDYRLQGTLDDLYHPEAQAVIED